MSEGFFLILNTTNKSLFISREIKLNQSKTLAISSSSSIFSNSTPTSLRQVRSNTIKLKYILLKVIKKRYNLKYSVNPDNKML